MSDKTDAWMPLWIGAYLADTMHLTTVQHGAYLLLLMAYWRDRAPLPDDDDHLRTITKTERAEWKRMRPVLAKFFRVEGGVWWHKRVEKEIEHANGRSEKAKEKASKAAEARWEKAGKRSSSNAPSNAPSIPQAMHKECPTPSPTPKTIGNQSASVDQPPLADPPPAAADPIHSRAIELTALLRKRGAALQASDPRVRGWAENGVTDAQALTALDTAQERRAEQANPQPINAGYLDAILRDAGAKQTKRRTIHDDRADTIAALTGRNRGEGNIIDGQFVQAD